MWEDVFTIISNLAFILPIAEGWRRDKLATVLIYSFQMFSSGAYHSCNSFSDLCFGLPPRLLRDMDFFWAQYLIFLTALNLILFPTGTKFWKWLPPLLMAAAGTTIFLLQRWIGESTYLQFGIAAVGLGGLLTYWITYGCYRWMEVDRDGELLPPYKWRNLVFGLALSGLASSLYVTEMQSHNMYWSIHSVWHVAAAFGQYFLLKSWSRKRVVNYQERAILLNPIRQKAVAVGINRFVHITPASRV